MAKINVDLPTLEKFQDQLDTTTDMTNAVNQTWWERYGNPQAGITALGTGGATAFVLAASRNHTQLAEAQKAVSDYKRMNSDIFTKHDAAKAKLAEADTKVAEQKARVARAEAAIEEHGRGGTPAQKRELAAAKQDLTKANRSRAGLNTAYNKIINNPENKAVLENPKFVKNQQAIEKYAAKIGKVEGSRGILSAPAKLTNRLGKTIAKGGALGKAAALVLTVVVPTAAVGGFSAERSEAETLQKINEQVETFNKQAAADKAATKYPSPNEWLPMLQTAKANAEPKMAKALEIMIEGAKKGKHIDFYDAAVKAEAIDTIEISEKDAANPTILALHNAQVAAIKASMNKQMLEAVRSATQQNKKNMDEAAKKAAKEAQERWGNREKKHNKKTTATTSGLGNTLAAASGHKEGEEAVSSEKGSTLKKNSAGTVSLEEPTAQQTSQGRVD